MKQQISSLDGKIQGLMNGISREEEKIRSFLRSKVDDYDLREDIGHNQKTKYNDSDGEVDEFYDRTGLQEKKENENK